MPSAVLGARYVHTNLVARDWQRLATFYEAVFGCQPVPPARDYAEPALGQGSGVPNARLRGVHLRLPPVAPNGPTLEIYQYEPALQALSPAANRPGFGHLAFAVADVAQAREAVLAHGGGALGEIVTLTTSDGRHVTWTYVTDPEGNILELQRWQELY